MKTGLILCFFVLSFGSLFAQNKTPVIKGRDTIKISMGNFITSQKLSNNINRLEIIDLRDDTISLGYCLTGLSKKIKRIMFDSASHFVLRNWFCSYLKINPENKWGDQLLIIVKKLRLSNEANLHVFDNGHQGQAQNGWDEGGLIKMEFYLNKDQFYYPLYRYDSVISIKGKLPKEAPEFLSTAFKSALAKLFTLRLNEVPATMRKVTLQDIITKNSKETAIPILVETTYRKGVYKTFDEFKMNSPSVIDFEYRKGKFGDILYVKEGENEYPDRTAWGFSDGKSLFINSSDLFSELIREGNTFYFRGVKSVTRKALHNPMKTSLLNLATNTGEKRTSYSIDNKYYQIDMETGEVY